jgi:hypothetical protein
MTTALHTLSEEFVRAVNAADSTAFLSLFAEDATVDDNFREFRGRAAIQEWAEREIFAVQVRLEVLKTSPIEGGVRVVTEVDGNFDRTGLPERVIINQDIQEQDGKIVQLTCRLAEG